MLALRLKILIQVSCLFLLASCQSSPADHALAMQNFGRLMGKPAQQAVDMLGSPDKVINKPAATVYQWNSLKDEAPLSADYSPDPENLQCTISVLARQDGTIAKGRIVGNARSCHKYDEAINDYFPSNPNGKLINRSYLRRADDRNIN